MRSWIRDWITKHRIAQEAEKTTGSGDQGGAAATREETAIADEMNNLVAEIDRIDKARRTSDKEASDKEKLGEDIRNESLRGLQVHLRKSRKRKKTNDDAGDDDEADEASSRLGKVPHVTPDKGTRLTRCGGTPDSSGGSDDGRSLESLMADFASAKQAGVKGKETTADAELLKAKAALLDGLLSGRRFLNVLVTTTSKPRGLRS